MITPEVWTAAHPDGTPVVGHGRTGRVERSGGCMADAPIDLDALEALIAAATERPWECSREPVPYHGSEEDRLWDLGPRGSGEDGFATLSSDAGANARLIVAAVNALPALLARLRAAEAERDVLRKVAEAARAFMAVEGLWTKREERWAEGERLRAALDACPKAGGE